MTGAHFHLIVNHLPIVFPIVALIVLVLGLIFKSDSVIRTAYFIFMVGSITIFIAMESGEAAEDVVEKLNMFSDAYIEKHEEAAEVFAVLTHLLAGLSLLGFWANFRKKSFSTKISVSVLVYTLVVLFFAKQTGTTGGQIMHKEIRENVSGSSSD